MSSQTYGATFCAHLPLCVGAGVHSQHRRWPARCQPAPGWLSQAPRPQASPCTACSGPLPPPANRTDPAIDMWNFFVDVTGSDYMQEQQHAMRHPLTTSAEALSADMSASAACCFRALENLNGMVTAATARVRLDTACCTKSRACNRRSTIQDRHTP